MTPSSDECVDNVKNMVITYDKLVKAMYPNNLCASKNGLNKKHILEYFTQQSDDVFEIYGIDRRGNVSSSELRKILREYLFSYQYQRFDDIGLSLVQQGSKLLIGNILGKQQHSIYEQSGMGTWKHVVDRNPLNTRGFMDKLHQWESDEQTTHLTELSENLTRVHKLEKNKDHLPDLTILTQNMHQRPMMNRITGAECDVSFQNAQSVRSRVFVEQLMKMTQKPDILLLQEVTDRKSEDVLHKELLLAGYIGTSQKFWTEGLTGSSTLGRNIISGSTVGAVGTIGAASAIGAIGAVSTTAVTGIAIGTVLGYGVVDGIKNRNLKESVGTAIGTIGTIGAAGVSGAVGAIGAAGAALGYGVVEGIKYFNTDPGMAIYIHYKSKFELILSKSEKIRLQSEKDKLPTGIRNEIDRLLETQKEGNTVVLRDGGFGYKSFSSTVGADSFGNKGILGRKIRKKKNNDFVGYVFVTHPGPYVDTNSKILKGLQYLNFDNINTKMNYRPDDVASIHIQQLLEVKQFIAEYIDVTKQKTNISDIKGGIFVGGDMNINMYQSYPGGMAEKYHVSGTKMFSQEYYNMLSVLDAYHPTIIPDVDQSRFLEKQPLVFDAHNKTYVNISLPAGFGMVTWDAFNNKLATDPLWDEQIQWIDYIFHITKVNGEQVPLPFYMDNRAISLRSPKTFPELGLQWTKKCYDKKQTCSLYKSMEETTINDVECLKNRHKSENIKNIIEKRKEYGLDVLRRKSDGTIDYETYGYMSDDNEIVNPSRFGYPLKESGNPFRMLDTVSDHYGVLSTVYFDSKTRTKTQEYLATVSKITTLLWSDSRPFLVNEYDIAHRMERLNIPLDKEFIEKHIWETEYFMDRRNENNTRIIKRIQSQELSSSGRLELLNQVTSNDVHTMDQQPQLTTKTLSNNDITEDNHNVFLAKLCRMMRYVDNDGSGMERFDTDELSLSRSDFNERFMDSNVGVPTSNTGTHSNVVEKTFLYDPFFNITCGFLYTRMDYNRIHNDGMDHSPGRRGISNSLYIVFKMTDSTPNPINMKLDQSNNWTSNLDTSVDRGFHPGYIKMHHSMQYSFIKEVKRYCKKYRSIRNIFITGMSLGGAMAQLFGLDCYLKTTEIPSKKVHVTTFGSPPVMRRSTINTFPTNMFKNWTIFGKENDPATVYPDKNVGRVASLVNQGVLRVFGKYQYPTKITLLEDFNKYTVFGRGDVTGVSGHCEFMGIIYQNSFFGCYNLIRTGK